MARTKDTRAHQKEDKEFHAEMLEGLRMSQDADTDNRRKVREAHLFIKDRDGQWEPYWWDIRSDQPRYSFDLTSPIIDDIAGSMEKSDFAITIDPADGVATKETAETLNGLIRNIQNISKANNTFNSSARSMVIGGMDGWRVVQKFVDDDSFHQDLMIENINNYVDRVWFGVRTEEQDASDSKDCWVMHSMPEKEYKKKYPNGSGQSVTDDKIANAYFNKPDVVIVGEYYFIKESKRELVLMSNGKVHEAEDLEKVKDEIRKSGLGQQVIETDRRTITKHTVFIRKFDQSDWLEEENETVFSSIPVVPEYANYSIFENKVIYYGAVEKEIDPQRVLNYSLSREVEEVALAPRKKPWMTEAQAAGHENELETLNTNNNPVQYWNVDPEAPGFPQELGGPQVNPGLRVISEGMINMMDRAANRFDASRGDNPNNQSGVAVKALMSKSDVGNIKYSGSAEIAIARTCDILVKAIPKIYTEDRIVRILGEDGTAKMVQLNQTIRDDRSGEDVIINDLSVGKYGVTCTVGPSFDSRQDDTVASILEAAQIYAPIMETGADIFANNIPSPGMTEIAERLRQQRFEQGLIPETQWTDEEKEKIQIAKAEAAEQQQQPTPEEMIGQAELIKAQNEQTETQIGVQEKGAKIQLAAQKQQLEENKFQASVENERTKNQITQSENAFDQFLANQKQQMDQIAAILENNKTMAETLNLLANVIPGIITGPGTTNSFIDQAENLHQSIEDSSALEQVTAPDRFGATPEGQ